jgi:signal transduction histidine kinase
MNSCVVVIVLSLCSGAAFAQTAIDSLELFHPYNQVHRIRYAVQVEMSSYPSVAQQRRNVLQARLDEVTQQSDTLARAGLLTEMGLLAYDYQHYPEAIRHFLSALALYEQKGAGTDAFWTRLFLFDAYRLSDLTIAFPLDEMLEQARKDLRNEPDAESEAALLYRDGVLLSDTAASKEYLRLALNIQDSLMRVRPGELRLQREYARYLNGNRKFPQALEWAEKTNQPAVMVFVLNNMGDEARKKQNLNEAMRLFNRSKTISLENHLKTLLRNSYQNIANVYWTQKKYNEAFLFRGLTMFLMEDLWSVNTSEQVAQLRTLYETEKKEWENYLLQKDIAVRDQKLEQEKLYRIWLFFTLSGAIATVFIVVHYNRRIKKGAVELAEKHAIITTQRNTLQAAEAELRHAQRLAKISGWKREAGTGILHFSDDAIPVFRGAIHPSNAKPHVLSADSDVWESFVLSLEKPDASAADIRIKAPDGTLHWLRFQKAALVYGQEHQPVSGTVQDITESKEAEAKRLELVRTREFTVKLMESQEEERKRIASELHDGVGQEMLLIKNRALLAGRKRDALGEAIAAHVDAISDTATRLIDTIRRIIYDLRPVHLDKLGLTETLRLSAESACTAAGIALHTALEKFDNHLPASAELHLFRLVQEVLNNMVKYSGATEFRFVSRFDNGSLVLELADNGRGFDVEQARKAAVGKSLGLANIQQRAAAMGAQVTLASETGQGTRCTVIFGTNLTA